MEKFDNFQYFCSKREKILNFECRACARLSAAYLCFFVFISTFFITAFNEQHECFPSMWRQVSVSLQNFLLVWGEGGGRGRGGDRYVPEVIRST